MVAESLPSTTLGFNLSEYTELQECAAESAPRSIPHDHLRMGCESRKSSPAMQGKGAGGCGWRAFCFGKADNQ